MMIWSLLAKSLRGYEERPQQKRLSQAIYNVFCNGGHLLAEGPCGVGKSMAYLLAFVEANPTPLKRILVLTSNNTLLAQLYKKDLPLMEDLAILQKKSIEWTMLQGKSNYLCKRVMEKRYFEGKTLATGMPQEMRSEWQSIHDELLALDRQGKHWLGHIDSNRAYDYAKARYTIPSQKCGMSRCPEAGSCELAITRELAPGCHVIAANYHLWIVDSLLSLFSQEYSSTFGKVDAIVFDEAHELPEVARDYFALHLSDGFIENVCQHLSDMPLQNLRMSWKMYRKAWEKRENGLTSFLPDRHTAELFVQALMNGNAFITQKQDKSDSDYRCMDELQRRVDLCADALLGTVSNETHAYGIEWKPSREKDKELEFSMQCIEISPGRILQRLIPQDIPVVALSATMTTSGKSFAFIQNQIGMPKATTMAVETPFDVSKSKVFCINQSPDPNEEEPWVNHCVDLIHIAANTMNGRTLALFTSTVRMNKAAQKLREKDPRYTILAQGDASTAVLTEQFRSNPHAVLLGVNSFWTGLDVKGDSLSVVFVERVPFLSPADVINQAQTARLGKKAFLQFALPHAMIRLKQGVGRLIRSNDDMGLVLFADARLKDKGYGKNVLNQVLPGAQVVYGSTLRLQSELQSLRKAWEAVGIDTF